MGWRHGGRGGAHGRLVADARRRLPVKSARRPVEPRMLDVGYVEPIVRPRRDAGPTYLHEGCRLARGPQEERVASGRPHSEAHGIERSSAPATGASISETCAPAAGGPRHTS